MSIPLVQKPEKDDINTSIIAIKRNIERINMLLGLVDNDSPDLSGFATKQELQDAVTELQPVDTVTVGNMHSVTSNAVAQALSWNESFQEKKTSETWVNGKPIYRKGFQESNLNINNNVEVLLSSFLSGISIDALIKLQGTVKFPNVGVTAEIPSRYINLSYHTSDGGVYINNQYSSDSNAVTVVLYAEYTKTTD